MQCVFDERSAAVQPSDQPVARREEAIQIGNQHACTVSSKPTSCSCCCRRSACCCAAACSARYRWYCASSSSFGPPRRPGCCCSCARRRGDSSTRARSCSPPRLRLSSPPLSSLSRRGGVGVGVYAKERFTGLVCDGGTAVAAASRGVSHTSPLALAAATPGAWTPSAGCGLG